MNSRIHLSIVILGGLLIAGVAGADVSGTLDSDASERATYPGASDEEELRVQEELYEPQQKVYKTHIHKQVLDGLVKKQEAAKDSASN